MDLELQKKETIHNHASILKMQQDTKKLALIIRDEKQCIQKSEAGQQEFKSLADKNDDLVQKNIMLEEHTKKLQAKQEATKKKFKQDANMYDKRLLEIDQENKVLSVRLKEKDQEVKLHELKVRELKKAIPNTRLRPLKSRHNTVDQANVLFKSKIYQKVGSRFRTDQLYQEEGKALTEVYQGIDVNRKL